MSIIVRCQFCGHLSKAPNEAMGRRAECPYCGKAVEVTQPTPAQSSAPSAAAVEQTDQGAGFFESAQIEHFFDPPKGNPSTIPTPPAKKNLTWERMFQALLDPRAIQWMLMIGGGLCVLGLVIWLISLGVFKDPHVLAVVLGIGT